jgi:WD40 repeat protein
MNDGRSATAAAPAVGPYLGLRHYTEADAEWFFGRESECATIVANIRASRLTILYAPSGVGKSSLLRAGVASQLQRLAERRHAERGSPRYVPVVFAAWKDDPVEALIRAIESAVGSFLGSGCPGSLPRDGLLEAINGAAAAIDSRPLIILDQFEEYFLHGKREPAERPFVDELARCLNEDALRANCLIAIREDAYASLGDLFAGKIPNVYRNYLQLHYLDRGAAREAIVRPVEHFNRTRPQMQPIELEPALVEEVLDQVRAGEVVLGRGQAVVSDEANGRAAAREEIETPYLQLVMASLWAHEQRLSSRVLKLATLQELGGAQEIVRAHLEGALTALADDDRDTAVDVFQHLVTPSGAKVVHGASDLAAMVSRTPEQVRRLLTKLASGDTRIVRHVPPPAGRTQPDDRYEIFHDVLSPAIVAWRERALEQRRAADDARERERLEREARLADERAQQEARRRRSFQRLALGASVLLVVALVLGVLAFLAQRSAVSSQHTAQSRQLAASAEAVLSSDPELSTLLALRAVRVDDTTQAESAVRDAVPQLEVLKSLHAGSLLLSAAFSPDGAQVVTAGADGTARVWDVEGGRQIGALRVGSPLVSAAFTPNGREILTLSEDGVAALWDVASARRLRAIGPGATSVEAAALSPDGRELVTAGSDGRVIIWNASTGAHLTLVGTATGGIRSVAFDPRGTHVVASTEDGSASVWSVSSRARTVVLHVHTEGLVDAAFSPDGARIVTAGTGGTARIWDSSSARQLLALNGDTGTVYAAAFSPDGSKVVTASEDGTTRIWDSSSGRQVNLLSANGGIVRSAGFSPNGAEVVTASEDGQARIWDAAPRELSAALYGAAVNDAAFDRTGAKVVTAGYDGRARIWSAATGKQLMILNGGTRPMTSASFSPQGGRIVTTSEDGDTRVWDESSGRQLAVLPGVYGVESAAFNPDQTAIVVASEDGTSRIWPLSGGKHVIRLGHEGTGFRVYSAVFSPDGREVATASEDGTVRVWDASTGGEKEVLAPHAGIMLGAAFSPDGTELVTAGADGTARIWSVAGARQLAVLNAHSGPVTSAGFNRRGTKVVTSGADGTARIWDPNGQQLAVLRGEAGRINSSAFSPGGRTVVIASDDGAAIWSAELSGSVQQLERIARARLQRRLTRAELRAYGLAG